METSSSIGNLHVAILSSPGMGHLIPVLVLADRLAAVHRLKVTVLQVTVAGASPLASTINLPVHKGLIQVINLPPVDISHLIHPSMQVVTQLCLIVRHALPKIRSAMTALRPIPDALFVDHFGTDVALPVAADLSIPKYLYVPSTAWFTTLTLYMPILDQEIKGEYVDQKEFLKIPGCKPIRPVDVVDPMLDRSDQQYEEYVAMGKQFAMFDGIMFNTWEDLEPMALRALRENQLLKRVMDKPVYPIGPLTRPVESARSGSSVIAWLDRQPNESVIYISFGSGGVLSAEQMTELAWGLELSRQRFLWVIRQPTKGRVDDAFFNTGNQINNGPDYLPEGFLSRTHDVGFLVPNWAQQVEVLNHPAVGGFLTHCGWNSSLESIISGVPMIAWPLYAEQRMNAAFLAEEAGVAARIPMKKVVGREEIEKLVRGLMEGDEGKVRRQKIKTLKKSGLDGLKVCGASYGSINELLSDIVMKRKLNE